MLTNTLINFTTIFGGNIISLLPFYSLLNSILLATYVEEKSIGVGLKAIGTGITSIGMVGAAIGQGVVGYGACISIGRNPESAPKVTGTLIITAGFCESGAIYALVIAILLIFVS